MCRAMRSSEGSLSEESGHHYYAPDTLQLTSSRAWLCSPLRRAQLIRRQPRYFLISQHWSDTSSVVIAASHISELVSSVVVLRLGESRKGKGKSAFNRRPTAEPTELETHLLSEHEAYILHLSSSFDFGELHLRPDLPELARKRKRLESPGAVDKLDGRRGRELREQFLLNVVLRVAYGKRVEMVQRLQKGENGGLVEAENPQSHCLYIPQSLEHGQEVIWVACSSRCTPS